MVDENVARDAFRLVTKIGGSVHDFAIARGIEVVGTSRIPSPIQGRGESRSTAVRVLR